MESVDRLNDDMMVLIAKVLQVNGNQLNDLHSASDESLAALRIGSAEWVGTHHLNLCPYPALVAKVRGAQLFCAVPAGATSKAFGWMIFGGQPHPDWYDLLAVDEQRPERAVLALA